MTFQGNQAYETMKPTTVGSVEAVVFETFHRMIVPQLIREAHHQCVEITEMQRAYVWMHLLMKRTLKWRMYRSLDHLISSGVLVAMAMTEDSER